MSDVLLTFQDLTLGYARHAAVHHLNGSVARGEKLAIVGGNGSGKSTLLKGITGFVQPMGGKLLRAKGCRIAYLPQSAEIDRSFPARVIDLVRLGLWDQRGLWGRFRRDDDTKLKAALARVGLEGFEDRPIDALSGGQFQRALFARVIVQDADLILLDEPFNGIDEQTQEGLLKLIDVWHHEGRTVIAVLHDIARVRAHFPRTLLLARDLVAFGPTDEVLTDAQIAKARQYREAWDEQAPWCGPSDHAHSHHDHKAA